MKTTILLVMALCIGNAFAQRGYSISGAAYAYHHGNSNNILPSRFIVEEEIFNYHTHDIAKANANSPVRLSHIWGNEKINKNTEEMVLQIGLSTIMVQNLDEIPPANLSLVVDISGSMGGTPIEQSKMAMQELVKQLRPTDNVSLVLFGNSVQIPHKSQPVGDKKELLRAIQNISIHGSTDVHKGMQAGYAEVASTYMPRGNNRVIVFTDAMANTGVIDPNQILANTKVYIKDIDLTFIGIGMRFNQDFARTIKTRLRGHMHFVSDSREVTKLFKDEVEQFFAKPYGKDVQLTIELPEQLELEKFYGYRPIVKGKTIKLNVSDMQGGLTQVFMLKLKRKKGGDDTIDPVEYSLSFNDQSETPRMISKKTEVLNQENDGAPYDKLANSKVKKNYSIAYMAGQLKQASVNYENDENEERFFQTINHVLAGIHKEYPNPDQDIQYVRDLLEKQTKPEVTSTSAIALVDEF